MSKLKHNVPYLAADAWDTIGKLQGQIETGGYFLRDDGKIDYKKRMHHDPPWLYWKHQPDPVCHLAHHILFNVVFNQAKIPSMCLECWKVVVAPRNLRELMALWEVQKRLNRPCKCGTEGDRPNSTRLYGGYFYNRSVEEGQECWELVRGEIAKRKKYTCHLLGTAVEVWFGMDFLEDKSRLILKRGCTEFEQALGDSREWAVDEEQLQQEEIIKASVVYEPVNHKMSDHQIAHTIKKWIHNAYKWGDETYLLFTEGNPLYSPVVTYHKEQDHG